MGRVGVSPAGDRVSRSRTFKDRFGKMPKPVGEKPTLPGNIGRKGARQQRRLSFLLMNFLLS